MLNAVRRLASSWFGKILGGLLIISLAGFGIYNVLGNLNSNTVARAGNTDISLQTFQRAYNAELNRYAQQLGYVPTAQQANTFGIPSSVMLQLASDAALNQFGENLGLGVSDAKLAQMTRDDPSFAGLLGTFDRANFSSVLQQNGFTEAEYFELQTRAARRQQLQIGITESAQVSQTGLDMLNRYGAAQRTVEYFTLNANSLDTPFVPTDADLSAYLKDHQTDYRTKEVRTAEVMQLTPEILATLNPPAEDAIKAEYEQTKDQLVKIEKREIQQVVLPDDAAATLFQQQLEAGTDFAAALSASKLTATNLGTLTKTEVTDAALADAAFALPQEGSFIIIPGVVGKRVIAVTKIEPGGAVSYEDAKAEISARLALTAAKAQFADTQDQIEELRAAFKPLKDIADRFKIPLQTLDLTLDGSQLIALPGIDKADYTKVTTPLFAAEVGKLAPTVGLSSTNNVWFELSKVEPARDQTLDEVRDAITTAWTNGKIDEELQNRVSKMLTEMDNGKSFADVATESSQTPQISSPMLRAGDGTPVLNQTVARAIFSGGPDHYGAALNADGDYVVFHVTDVTNPETPVNAQTKNYLEESTRLSMFQGLKAAVAKDMPLTSFNQQALEVALGLDATQ